MLSSVQTVTATFLPLESGYVHVTLAADAAGLRRSFIGGALGVGSAGVAATAILAVLTPFALVAVAPLPMAAAIGYFTIRQYGPRIGRIQLGLERALDHLQQGGARARQLPPKSEGLASLLANEVRKALKS